MINAVQAIDGWGTITLRTGLGEGTVWIEVVDTGCGIAPENLSLIFAPFYTTKPVGVGTGLGLSLSYSIVRRHGGRFEVESVVGQGSTFRIVLPIRQAGEAAERGNA
jgi:two-component system NtrC family sensor kinase